MQTLYMKEQIKTLEKKVAQLRQIVSLIVNLLTKYEGGSELLENIKSLEKEGN